MKLLDSLCHKRRLETEDFVRVQSRSNSSGAFTMKFPSESYSGESSATFSGAFESFALCTLDFGYGKHWETLN